jgi:hypothetical protein
MNTFNPFPGWEKTREVANNKIDIENSNRFKVPSKIVLFIRVTTTHQ